MPFFERLASAPGLAAALLVSLALPNSVHAAQNPFDVRPALLAVGQPIPPARFIDQRGHAVSLSDFKGSTVVLGFIYTACTDECPLISQKFHALQLELAGGPFHLAEVSIDPARDSPSAMASYAKRFRADASRWSMLSGQSGRVLAFDRALGVSMLGDGHGRILHNNRVIIVGPDGLISDIINEASWTPADVAAAARQAARLASNPLARLDLALGKAVAALCGSTQSGRSGITDLLAVIGLFAVFGVALYRMARLIFVSQA